MAKRETTEVTGAINLEIEDMRLGLEMKEDVARAQAKLQATHDIENKFHDRMAAKYGVDLATFEFVDWITGWRLKGG